MGIRGINWVRAIGGAVLAEAAQIAAAFGWVAIYSYLINPGQPMAVYQAHAEDSGPWVAVFAGFVIFYCVSRWIARSLPTALALFAVFVVVDVLLLVLAAAEVSIAFVVIAAGSYLTKLLACYLGGRRSAAAPV